MFAPTEVEEDASSRRMRCETRRGRERGSSRRRRGVARRKRTAAEKLLISASLVNLAAVVALAVILHTFSEKLWLVAAATYLPRAPYLAPSIVLLALSAVRYRKWIWVNAAAAVVVMGPVMGLCVPYEHVLEGVDGVPLKVVSYNVQRFEPDFAAALVEVGSVNPDVVCLQECPEAHRLLGEVFRGWHSVQVDEYWVGSRYPVRLLGECESVPFHRIAAIAVEVDGPAGPFRVFNVHQTTAREGLDNLGVRPILEGDGVEKQERFAALREAEAAAVRLFVSEQGGVLPYVAVGDFNAPTDSSLYRSIWGDLTNAFDVAGFGFGYTAPVKRHRLWPDYTPWLRIDHILTSPQWVPEACWVGSGTGSDHRMVAAVLRLEADPVGSSVD